MNELTSLGVILLFALLAGHLVKFARIPEVTGYLLAGVVVGPWGLRWISHENLAALKVFSEVGLGLILFALGAAFDFARLRATGRRLVIVTLAESTLAAAAVFIAMLALGQPLAVAVLLGVIAVPTGAASTLMVLRECNSEGPLTATVTGVIGLNNVLALIAFSLAAAGIETHSMVVSSGLTGEGLFRALFPLLWQTLGSCAVGFLVGLLLAGWASRVREAGETLILLMGCVLLTVGLASILGVSALVASLAVGATMANLSGDSRRLFGAIARTDPPLYVIFFVLAGAEVDVSLLPSLGLLGVAYVICRAAGKIVGSWVATDRLGFEPMVRRHLGQATLAQAGLAIGLVILTKNRFPEHAPIVTTVVLGAVAVFELIGPVAARFALDRSGESRPQKHEEFSPL